MAIERGIVMAGEVGKPLRLKDYLELDCDSCSAAGFRCYPRRLCVAGAAPSSTPMRQLLDGETPGSFVRSPSLRRRPKLSGLSRSLSRRLKGGFWKRREEESAGSPVAAVSSSSDYSETSESGSSSTERKSESDFSSASSESLHAAAAIAAGDEPEVTKGGCKEDRRSGLEMDDKEQFSPVAIMDFPSNDDKDEKEEDVVKEEERKGGGACSPSFNDSLRQLQKRRIQLQRRFRQFGSLRNLGAADLEVRFAALESGGLDGEDVPAQQLQRCVAAVTAEPPHWNGHRSGGLHQESDGDKYSLVGLLLTVTASVVAVDDDGASEWRLLVDFFAETKKLNKNSEAAVRVAKRWLDGREAQWGLEDVICHREDVVVAEMEPSRRWMRVVGDKEEEEREVGVVVAGLVVDELVDELVRDLFV